MGSWAISEGAESFRLFQRTELHSITKSMLTFMFLHDRPWISPWIKSISNELNISCHVFASQLSGHCDVIADRLWGHQQNVMRASETRGLCVKILVLASFMDSLCRVRNRIMYVLSSNTRVLFWCLFYYKHQITLLWVHKQFATRVHTLFSIYSSNIFQRGFWLAGSWAVIHLDARFENIC